MSGRYPLLAAVLALTACGQPAPEQSDAARPVATVSLQAVTVLEPPQLAIGATARIEIAVITPPGWRIPPPGVPASVDGLGLLGAERPEVEQHETHWVHRHRFQLRALRTGDFVWPAGPSDAVSPDDQTQTLIAPERPFSVVSVLEENPSQRAPYSLRAPPGSGPGGNVWLAAAGGALATLLAVAAVALVRRRREQRRNPPPEEEPPGAGPWRATQAVLSTATELVDSDPVRAANMASTAIRHYIAQRYRADLETATSEELREREPPFVLTTRWQALLGLLDRFDAVRFPPPGQRQTEPLRAAIAEASELIVRISPQGNWRG